MNEQSSIQKENNSDSVPLVFIQGKIIFDSDGIPVGIAAAHGSLDYTGIEEIVLIIKPKKTERGNHE